jgi:ATPase subunit of ABC transporter with duplicated ATPase domains
MGTTLEPALVAIGIAKWFGDKAVLEDAGLEIRPGEAVAIVGENGAGKSTLLRICAGLIRADGGRVGVDGRIGYCPGARAVRPADRAGAPRAVRLRDGAAASRSPDPRPGAVGGLLLSHGGARGHP